VQTGRFAAGGDDLADHCLRAGIVDVGDDDFGAFTRQSRRACCADSRRTPGYDRDLALGPIVSSLLCKSQYHACTISSSRAKSSGTSSASLAAAT
jgi:hypothetical protein